MMTQWPRSPFYDAADEALSAMEGLAELVVTHKLPASSLKPAIEKLFENIWYCLITNVVVE